MRNWFYGLLLASLSAWVTVAQGGILQASVLEDPDGLLTIQEVTAPAKAGAFVAMGDTLARGYTQTVFWVRLKVAAHAQAQYLRVRPPYLDRVTLYKPDPDEASGWIDATNGDLVPMSQRQVWGVSLLFALPASDAAQTMYLRLQTRSSSLMNLEVLPLQAFQQQEFHTMLLQLVLISVMLGLLVWAAFDYLVNRQRIVGVFLVVQAAQIGYVLAVGGYLPLIVPNPLVADQLTSLLVALVVAITLVFHRLLMAEFEPSRWALWLLNLMIALSLLAMMSVLAGKLQFGLPLNSMLVAVLIPLLLWLAFSAKRNSRPGLFALRATYVALALVLCFVMAPIFGVWVSFDLYIWATTTQGLLTGVIMAAFLFTRSMAMQRQSIADQLQLARVQEKLLSEQQRAADQRQFLDMLAHELKTPLGVIQLTLDSVNLSATQQKRLHRSLDTMSAVIDRCRLSLQLDEGKLTPVLEEVDISDAVRDLVLTCKEPKRIALDDAGLTLTRTDRQLFLVILHNLLDNAVKYAVPETQITVSTKACEQDGKPGICVMVHNEVTHRPVLETETLFDKYFRGPNATGQTGSGLGLHLSRRLAMIIGAGLWAELGSNDIKLCLWIPN